LNFNFGVKTRFLDENGCLFILALIAISHCSI
jgi:hypothetical protein